MDTFEQNKQLLQDAVLPRPARYRIVTDRMETPALPWGLAMAHAMRSLRNGAQVGNLGGGTIKLTNGNYCAVWYPAD